MPFAQEGLQTTIAGAIFLQGKGVHSGQPVRLTLRPASAGSGVTFIRTDEPARTERKFSDTRRNVIAATPSSVEKTTLGTTLRNAHGVSIATVEHFMAAATICGVDNIIVEADACELPILDGSAEPFVAAMLAMGFKTQDAPRRRRHLLEPVEVRDGDRFIRAEPATRFSMNVRIEFPDEACIGLQEIDLDFDSREPVRDRLAQARTFCRLHEVDALRAAGLCLGGSLDNAIVVDGGEVKNPQGLRDPQEFVLHKALDLVGDLALLGTSLAARIIAHKPGHDLNTRLAAAIETVESPELANTLDAMAGPERLTA